MSFRSLEGKAPFHLIGWFLEACQGPASVRCEGKMCKNQMSAKAVITLTAWKRHVQAKVNDFFFTNVQHMTDLTEDLDYYSQKPTHTQTGEWMFICFMNYIEYMNTVYRSKMICVSTIKEVTRLPTESLSCMMACSWQHIVENCLHLLLTVELTKYKFLSWAALRSYTFHIMKSHWRPMDSQPLATVSLTCVQLYTR